MKYLLVERSTQHVYCPWQYSVFLVDGDQKTQLTAAMDMHSDNLKHRLKRAKEKAQAAADIKVVYEWEG